MNLPEILSDTELRALFECYPEPDEFGYGSDNLGLCIALGAAPVREEIATWLRALACPVIGVGHSATAPACDTVVASVSQARALIANIRRCPLAAMVLVQHLRALGTEPVATALQRESMAFATVQSGPEFRAWLDRRARRPAGAQDDGPPVHLSRDHDRLSIVLNRPSRLNAVDAAMRDALFEAFRLAALDDCVRHVELSARGPCFSVGGDIAEFGEATSGAEAHYVRSVRLPALCLPAIANRMTVRIDGAAIGAGLEMASFARRIVATRRSWFQLPELRYGLIPGAGGTVGVVRRIGRHRTALMALSMRRIGAVQALEWGLIDDIVDQ